MLSRERVRAEKALRKYEEENKDWPPKKKRERALYNGLPITALAFLALAVFAWVTGPARTNSAWFVRGTNVASLVYHQPERVVTALTLHADGAHVFGNVLSGAFFGHTVEKRMGPGLGLLSIAVGGALGNFANAVFYLMRSEQHLSIGASTAVLASVGVLASTQALITRSETKERTWRDAITPIAGGLALLGTIGASPESDLGAHAFGFLGGLLVGAILFLAFGKKRASPVYQTLFGVGAASLIGGSWALAFAR